MKLLLAKLWALFYPPTKLKLHRIVSAVGTALAVASIALVWASTKLHLSITEQLGATGALLAIWGTSWRTLVAPKANEVIDGLDIPDGSTVEQKTTTLTEKTTTVTPPVPEAASPNQESKPTPITVPIVKGNRP